MEPLKNKEVPGIILAESENDYTDHRKNRGRYRVYIPTYMQHRGLESVIWCKNHVHKYRYGINESFEGDKLIYGEYKPLQIGSRVIVKFFANDLSTGYIDRLITDYEDDSLPFKLEHVDQNDVYVLLRTAKHHNLIAVLEDTETTDIPKNSFHIYYDDDQVRIVMNEDGMYTWVTKDKFARILQNNTVWIEKDNKHFIHGNNRYLIKGNNIICIKGTHKFIVHKLSEELYKEDRNQQIDNDKNTKIYGTNKEEIHGDDHLLVKQSRYIQIKENENKEIDGDKNTDVGGDKSSNVGNNDDTEIGGDRSAIIDGDDDTEIGGDKNTDVGNNRSVIINGEDNTNVGGNKNTDVGGEYNIKASVIKLNC